LRQKAVDLHRGVKGIEVRNDERGLDHVTLQSGRLVV